MVLLKVFTFVSKPTNESYVDTKISGLAQMMAALLGIMKKKDIKKNWYILHALEVSLMKVSSGVSEKPTHTK